MLEPKTNVAPQILTTSPNQIKLIVENKLVQVEFASTNEAKSMNIKDDKPALVLDIKPNQETKNSINTKNLLHKDNKKTKGIISKPIKETALQESVIKPRSGLPRSAVTEHNRISQAQAQTQEFRAARKSAGVTKKEMRTKTHVVNETIEIIDKQKTRELSPLSVLPKAPPKRPKSLNQGHQASAAHSPLMLQSNNRKQTLNPQHRAQRQRTERSESTKNLVEQKLRLLDENETFSISGINKIRGDAVTTDQPPTEETKHIAPEMSVAPKINQQLRDWAKIEPMIGLESKDLDVWGPTANVNFTSVHHRDLDLVAKQTKIPTKNSITPHKQIDKETSNNCNASNAEYKELNLKAINAVIKSKTTQIGQLLGQKLYPHQVARNQNIGDLLAQQTGRQAQQQKLGTLSIHQLIALKNMAAHQQIFLCQ